MGSGLEALLMSGCHTSTNGARLNEPKAGWPSEKTRKEPPCQLARSDQGGSASSTCDLPPQSRVQIQGLDRAPSKGQKMLRKRHTSDKVIHELCEAESVLTRAGAGVASILTPAATPLG